MPPLVGTPAEIADLRDYLATLIVQPTNRVAAPTVTAQAAR
jgi:hypothetical protein